MTGPKRVQAIVTAWLPGLSGFYLQEEPADSDGNDATSEGIFVYYGGTNPGVDANSVGQVVDLLGTVSEYRSQTQLTYQSGFVVQNGGAKVALPNDPSNLARALLVLQQGGLVKLTDFPGALAEMAHFGLAPAPLFAALVIALELLASAMILSGRPSGSISSA